MKKHLKKGFTLVELLVVLMLMGLVTTAVVMFIRPVGRIYTDINNKSDEETGSITLFNFLNGDLRYATQVQVVSTDTDTMPSAGSYQNFILLANTTRPNSAKGARGYAQFGKTANPAARGYCVSESILAENDFQFSVESYNTMDKQQSLTLKADCHPMKQNSAGTGFEVNTSKDYSFKEAIQFVNMRYASKLPSSITIGFSAGSYDASKPYTWILYTKPADISGSISLTPSGSNGFEAPDSSNKGNKTVAYGTTINTLTLVFQEGSIASGYKLVGRSDCSVSYDNGASFPSDPTFIIAPEVTINVNIPAGKEISVLYVNNAHIVYTETAAQLDAAGSHTVYIYNDGTSTFSHNTPYVDPSQYSDADMKYLEIHYVPTDSELENRGIAMYDHDSVLKSTDCIYYDNGSEVTRTIESTVTGSSIANPLFICAKQNQFVATVKFKKADAAIRLFTASIDNGSVTLGQVAGIYREADIAAGGTKVIYIYDNKVYDNEDDFKDLLPDRLNKDIQVHFVFDTSKDGNSQQDFCGLTFTDADTIARSSTTSMKAIPDNVTDANNSELCRIVQTASFDITVTLIKYNAKVNIFNSNLYYGYSGQIANYGTLDENSPDEIWVYQGVGYNSIDDLPGYKIIDKHVTVHYLGGGSSNTDGVALKDLDSYSESSQGNGEWVPDGGCISFGNTTENRDIDVDVLVRREATVVGVGGKQVGGSDMEGSPVVELNQNSPNEIWIYAGRYYNDETSAKAKRDADENGGGGADPSAYTESDPSCYKAVMTVDVTDTNKWLYINHYGYKCTVLLGDGTELYSKDHNQAQIDLSAYSGQRITLIIKLTYMYDQSADRKAAFGSDPWGNNGVVLNADLNGKDTSTYGSVDTYEQ